MTYALDERRPPAESHAETERRLLAETDYFYDHDDWETTHDDLCGVCEQTDLQWSKGKIVSVGRLKRLPTVFAVSLPISHDDAGEPDEWEVSVFETMEAAQAAYRAALRPQASGEG